MAHPTSEARTTMPIIAKSSAFQSSFDECLTHPIVSGPILPRYTRERFVAARLFRLIAIWLFCIPLTAQQAIPWLTRSGSNDRSGWNSNETQLTQNSVITKGVSLVTVV